METSLRYGGDAKALRIHAKQKLALDSKTHLQILGELDTKFGVPTFLRAVVRRFYPDFSASLGVGLQYDKREKLHYTIRAKKSFPVTTDGLFSFNVKGRCHLDKEFKERNSTGAAEFSWCILNFQNDQDVRLKLGYDLLDKVPYMQIRENNWTFNANGNGKWNVRFDL
ncbi:outer envelope pore protein 21, chloroplastic [Pyrus x bretschneideri]|uniref:outer envelope pore protein 21, chloroplastic n=1 Tax=Pyrus x bretschneideri TaxID=225117 RepID=UPI00202E207B|nr:outer envelope pore protein 21, chloroplastic [Pyrus x bretschneideri]